MICVGEREREGWGGKRVHFRPMMKISSVGFHELGWIVVSARILLVSPNPIVSWSICPISGCNLFASALRGRVELRRHRG